MSERAILRAVTSRYLDSDDFNGLPMDRLLGPRMSPRKLVRVVRALVEKGLIQTLRKEHSKNPFILQFGCVSVDEQLQALDGERPIACCLYPTKSHLATAVDRRSFEGRPFTLELALASPQLSYRNFEPLVLQPYVDDPRYVFTNNDVAGSICIHDSAKVAERDAVLLQTFGFSFLQGPPDSDAAQGFTRAVAVYLRYLSDLTAEHQTTWKAREVSGKFVLHPDYYRSSIQAEWGLRYPIHSALIEEMKLVNRMADAMGRSPFFRSTDKPRDLFFLLSPTRKNLGEYATLLDRLLSDNIDVGFFGSDVEAFRDRVEDGKTFREPKGSIARLDEWIRRIQKADAEIERMLKGFRTIRKARQKPVHRLNEDAYDVSVFQEQRELAQEAFLAVHLLRCLLASHPKATVLSLEAPKELNEGGLWFA